MCLMCKMSNLQREIPLGNNNYCKFGIISIKFDDSFAFILISFISMDIG